MSFVLPLAVIGAVLLSSGVVYALERPKRQRVKRTANIARLERELGFQASEAPVKKSRGLSAAGAAAVARNQERERQRKKAYALAESRQAAYAAWRLANNNKVWLPGDVEQRNPDHDSWLFRIW